MLNLATSVNTRPLVEMAMTFSVNLIDQSGRWALVVSCLVTEQYYRVFKASWPVKESFIRTDFQALAFKS